jgi:hypothetical protein
MISEYNLTPEQVEQLRSTVKSLKDQADFFGMEIDYETLKLINKSTYIKPYWKTRWEDSRDDKDFDERIDLDKEDK